MTPCRLARGFGTAAQPSLGRIGALEARLAGSTAEIRAAQKLRYRVFCEEMSAAPHGLAALDRREADAFDALCDHLLVIDHETGRVVATCRLLRQEVAERHFGFYTAGEFDVETLVVAKGPLRFLELGRSCVLASHRGRRAVELLWHGIWRYARRHDIGVMIGCASLAGTDPDRLALPLSFLHHHALAPEAWRVRARPHRRVAMDRMGRDAVDARAAFRALPPLLKGYLRLGAFVGDGAVIDRDFGTTDVCIVLPVSGISGRYVAHYGPDAGRYAGADDLVLKGGRARPCGCRNR